MSNNEKLQKQLKRVEIEKLKLRNMKCEENKRIRKARDTALYTLGAIFAHYYESSDPKDREFSDKLWRLHFKQIAPVIANDRRKQALKESFGLVVSDSHATNVDTY